MGGKGIRNISYANISDQVRFIDKLKYSSLNVEDKKWVVDYLSGSKGVIPYEMIKQWQDFNTTPNAKDFFFQKLPFTAA